MLKVIRNVFAAIGLALLIVAAQLPRFFGVAGGGSVNFFGSLHTFVRNLPDLDPVITAVGTVTLVVAIAARRVLRRVPYMAVAMIAGSVFAYILAAAGVGAVPTVGALPSPRKYTRRNGAGLSVNRSSGAARKRRLGVKGNPGAVSTPGAIRACSLSSHSRTEA